MNKEQAKEFLDLEEFKENFKILISLETKKQINPMLNFIKSKGFFAFVQQSAMGIEICVTNKSIK